MNVYASSTASGETFFRDIENNVDRVKIVDRRISSSIDSVPVPFIITGPPPSINEFPGPENEERNSRYGGPSPVSPNASGQRRVMSPRTLHRQRAQYIYIPYGPLRGDTTNYLSRSTTVVVRALYCNDVPSPCPRFTNVYIYIFSYYYYYIRRARVYRVFVRYNSGDGRHAFSR